MWICLQNHKSLDSFSFTTELQAPEPHREATRGNSQHTGRYLGAQSPWCSPQHTLCAEFPCSWSTLHFSGLTELGREVLTEQSALCLSPSQYGHWEQSQVSSKRFTWKESPLPEWVNLACWDNYAFWRRNPWSTWFKSLLVSLDDISEPPCVSHNPLPWD